MSIDNVKLPDDVERGAKGGPGFLTTIVTIANGDEARNQEWAVARGSWDIGYGIRTRAELEEVIQFFYARRGKARGFRFRDWLDYTITAEPTGGSGLTRQIQKTYSTASNPYTRNIILPDPTTLKVYVDNMQADPGDFTLLDNGIVQFGTDPGMNVKVSCEFDVPARFDVDNLGVSMEHSDAVSIGSIPIVELKSL